MPQPKVKKEKVKLESIEIPKEKIMPMQDLELESPKFQNSEAKKLGEIKSPQEVNLPQLKKSKPKAKISNHQLAIDGALESEVQKTFDVFDVFVNTLNKIDEAKVKL